MGIHQDSSPEEIWVYSACERATEWVIYFMVVFSPWAFGTTQPWSMQLMNGAGFLLGGLLAAKWVIRWATSQSKQNKNVADVGAGGQCHGIKERGAKRPPLPNPLLPRRRGRGTDARLGGTPRLPTRLLAGLTVLILGYCLISALNARATYLRSEFRFDYHPYLAWLPHSYDSISTWRTFWNYLAFALAFWAVVDWIVGAADLDHRKAGREQSRGDPNSPTRMSALPGRLKRLLWVICANGALLAVEGILQRASGSGKLLWLVEPSVHKEAATQFGPYAYRSNAAQYFTLIWPMALGFWWSEQRASRFQARPRSAHHLLLPCAMLMAACPLISLSRAGAIIGLGGIVAAFAILAFGQRSNWKQKLGLMIFLGTILLLAWYVGWLDLAKRFHQMDPDWDPSRIQLWRHAIQTARDFPLFGTGPGTFESLAQFYLDPQNPEWMGQLHNDWLETLTTWGGVGFGLILLALFTVLSCWFMGGGIVAHRIFVLLLWLALAGCLLYAIVDFPFQIYSILFLFMVQCAVLSCLSRKA